MNTSVQALAAVMVLLGLSAPTHAQGPAPVPERVSVDRPARLQQAQGAFYNARYQEAAAATLEPCTVAEDIAACELRTSALLFQMRRGLGKPSDTAKAWKQCAACPDLMAAFTTTLARGQALARARLQPRPDDDETRFLLGKLDLNYVWLHLGTLGRKTGWSEYWEARRSLDEVLVRHPQHVRARVARGWIDYIVDTRAGVLARWVLGGGSKERGLLAITQAADTDADLFTRAEARFALWDMQVREGLLTAAVATARLLARDFPDNPELTEFLKAQSRAARE